MFGEYTGLYCRGGYYDLEGSYSQIRMKKFALIAIGDI